MLNKIGDEFLREHVQCSIDPVWIITAYDPTLNSDKQYCSRPEWQKARRRKWQKEKLATDKAYRANQADCQRAWSQRHPEFLI
ncbi:MAG: hypothetical protein C4B58_16210 [Deltaproteobacteria bacterium]|nr:MAG: hypothetical protein C4B58_16210 [Deltaproteobacteria bacterium]